MKCIVLAAGYATRLYPLTENLHKSLLVVGEETILDFILQKIEKVTTVDGIYIITNDKFYNQLKEHTENYSSVTVLNDGTTSNDNRLGAIADLLFVIDSLHINEDILVMAGDNLFDFELTDFYDFFIKVNGDCITTYKLPRIDDLKRTGVIEIDDYNKVISFAEKPKNPKSNMAVPPFYIYKKETLPLMKKYLDDGNNPDAPGNFIPWLLKQKKVYAYKFSGSRYDIGTVESYERVKFLFENWHLE